MWKQITLLFLLLQSFSTEAANRTFTVDMRNEVFVRDGQPFRYISGIIHYFRVPSDSWRDRLHKLRMAGFNAVQTYVEWRSHEPYSKQYRFDGEFDLLHFIKLAEAEGLLVILRAGPYICAERDFGGFPFWLLQENPMMKFRTSDPSYLKYVDRWMAVLLPKIRPLLYDNGGPIISVQVENEYGSYPACDHEYMAHLRDLFRAHLGPHVVLFTVDGPTDKDLRCGTIPGLFATVDFGNGADVAENFRLQKLTNGGGPSVNSEYYSGWLDHWGHPHSIVDTEPFLHTFKEILDYNASVSVYMFHGGSNFEYSTGCDGPHRLIMQSYDYNAPLSEAGDPTYKYYKTRDLLKKYVPLPPGPLPFPSLKYVYDPVELHYHGTVFDVLPYIVKETLVTNYPIAFEAVGQGYGLILYETVVTELLPDPAVLSIPKLYDRGYIFIDQEFLGILSRAEDALTIPVSIRPGQKLQILVEGMGRDVWVFNPEMKGILSMVTLGKTVLQKWKMYMMPLNTSRTLLDERMQKSPRAIQKGPGVYRGEFVIPDKPDLPLDGYLHFENWTMGIIAINDYILGRYWPVMGPQQTVYIPKSILKPHPHNNKIALLEFEQGNCPNGVCLIKFTDRPILTAPTPYS